MPLITNKPDLLLFGTPTGIACTQSWFKAEQPGITTVSQSVDGTASVFDCMEILMRAASKHAPQNVLIASHSLSAMLHSEFLGESLEDVLGIPVHYMLPPLADSARLTCTKHVALLAETMVLNHPLTLRQLGLFAARGLKVTHVPCDNLAYMAHKHLQGGYLPDIATLRDFMAPIRADQRIDTVVMASTLVNQLRGMLEKAALRPFYWIDGAAVGAARFMASRPDVDESIIPLHKMM